MCWYFPKTREQFRISGILTAVMADYPLAEYQTARHQLWDQISDKGKLLWYWPQPKQPQDPVTRYVQEVPPDSKPPDTFALLLLDPHQVDHLQLKGDLTYPQTRHLYTRNLDHWDQQAVNP